MDGGLTCRRDEFFLPAGVHYLNCAYMAPLSRRVEEAGIGGLRQKRVPISVRPEDFFEGPRRLRGLFARLVHASDPCRVSIIPSVSYGIAVAARNLHPGPGENVVLADDQFPSNVLAWRRLCAETGAHARVVAAPPCEDGRAREWNRRLLEAIDTRTAVVALPQVHWTDGTRFDLVAIGERAREVGAALVVDGTQSVGAMPLDVGEIRPDALVCAGYKWMLGPYSIGLAYFGGRFGDGEPLEETWIARRGSQDFSGLAGPSREYRNGSARFDVGEHSNFILVPMMIAALEQLLQWGVHAIARYCDRLTREILDEAIRLGVWMEEGTWRGQHLFGLRPPGGMDPESLRPELARRGLVLSVRGDCLRISPNVYNDASDMGALAEWLRDLLA